MAFEVILNAPTTRPLLTVIPGNARTLRITAAAGTELAGAITQVPSSHLVGVFHP